MSLIKHLEILRSIRRKKYHSIIHKIHKSHNISKKTLFYIKEYGPHANVVWTILKESAKILLLASILSSFGGLALEMIKPLVLSIFPLVILLPTLNGLIGGYGTIVSSRFSTMLHEGKVSKDWWKNQELKKLFLQIIIVALITTLLSAGMALVLFKISQDLANVGMVVRVLLIALIDVTVLVCILFATSICAGVYFFKKGEDPNNFLIPMTTSIADFGNMMILALLIMLFF